MKEFPVNCSIPYFQLILRLKLLKEVVVDVVIVFLFR